ncbi:hypothetical protein F2Q68_00029024 [Brassica cretica]|uniref:E3 ubiquitin-protein ligase MARCHF6-like C-terminal domain-containing protein n=1 Tax=Brassica cretica TaxID=69181 RepID=A0A8S9G610_BRACR|nr:hypothetical protein F2Q68_00029024 [Brassica cretica]
MFLLTQVCGRSYSFVPVYSENAPERIPRREFLRGLSLRALRVAAYVFAILFNAFCFSLHPWGRRAAIENQRVFRVSEKFAFLLAGFLYNAWIAFLMAIMAVLKLMAEDFFGLLLEIDVEDDEPGLIRGVVARVFWKHMAILCDWWHDRLTVSGFIYVLVIEPDEAVLRPRNPQFHEFGAVRTFLFLLDDNAFAVLATSIYVSFFFVLLPFTMGRLVSAVLLLFQLMGVATQLLSGDSSLVQEPVLVGYLTMLSLSLAYLGSFATLSRDTIQAIAKRLSMGFLRVAMTLQYVLWRLEFLSYCPFVMILHWMFGQLCLLWVCNAMELIQKILQKRPFWFLLDVTDPNYKITKLYLGQFLFALAFHASLMVILVHLPILTISFISPSFFPIQLWFYEERIKLLSMFAYVSFARTRAMDWLAELIKPAIEPTVHKWIIIVSSWLQLSDFFLENHANQNVRPLLQQELEARDSWSLLGPIAEGSLVRFYGSQSDTTLENDIDEDRFIILRIGLMLVLAALSLVLISTISMALPILVGRTFFHSISFIMIKFRIKQDDVYGFWIGCYILRVSFIPMLLGLLIDLMIIIPSKVPQNESPVYSLLRDWLIGLVVLHIWTYLTTFTRVNCFATVACREKLKRIRSVGINTLPWTWLLGNVMCPIIKTLLITLAFPFWVANSLFPLLQFSGAVNQAVQRLIWPVLLAIIILGLAAKLTLDLFLYIHRVEYDDRYMVGDRVADFIEDHS